MGTSPSGWQTPKTNWQSADAVGATDLARIESNINALDNGSRTIDPAQAPTGNVGSLRQMLDWFANRIKAITGASNWYDAPATTLSAAKSHMDASAPHSGHIKRGTANTDVEQVTALLLRVDTRSVSITYDAQGRPSTIQEKDGANVVKTVTITYGPDGRPSEIHETAGGVTVTSTLTYGADGKLASVAKAVG